MSEPCNHILTAKPSLLAAMRDTVICPICGRKLNMRRDAVMAISLVAYASGIAISRTIFPDHPWQKFIVVITAVLFLWASLYWLLIRFLPFLHSDPVEYSATRYRIVGSVLLGVFLLILIIGLYFRADI